jgi:hypothetical protein
VSSLSGENSVGNVMLKVHDEWTILIHQRMSLRQGKTFPRLMAAIVGGLSLLLLVWFGQTFGTMPLNRWLRTLGVATCALFILGSAIWRDLKR